MAHPLIAPMAAHVLLAACLYVLLMIVRAPTIWGIGRLPNGGNPWAKFEPRISANLSNQFEWPLLFYVACMILLQAGASSLSLGLAWIFVVGRMCHSLVQILWTDQPFVDTQEP